uniref:AlNc14C285G10168 protein n=1 Tax=Albugo laibachii Nc14 TaxID=890382 RepID=F0WV22_9STRA|nr:AlNc14C285G10168 [Albugo laibachii Nc14]|eukprot:CCA25259.1 AlNc14C285G10168 [Albugo laibachii Nc14]
MEGNWLLITVVYRARNAFLELLQTKKSWDLYSILRIKCASSISWNSYVVYERSIMISVLKYPITKSMGSCVIESRWNLAICISHCFLQILQPIMKNKP